NTYFEPFKIFGDRLAINTDTDSNFSLNLAGGFQSDFQEISQYIRSTGYQELFGLGYDNPAGFSIYKKPSDVGDVWVMEIDELIIKNPESNYRLNAVDVQKFIDNSYRIVNIDSSGTNPKIEFRSNTGLAVNDLL